jgi:uncharacterized protein
MDKKKSSITDFYNPNLGALDFKEVVRAVFDYMNNDREKFYDIVVGCDSSSEERPSFPVAIVVLRVGYGGRFFFKKIRYPEERKFYNLHQRILQEIFISCEFALSLRDDLKTIVDSSKSKLKYQCRYIHADIGEKGRTRDMIKEVISLIKSNGFEAKIKPESFAASIVADRFT